MKPAVKSSHHICPDECHEVPGAVMDRYDQVMPIIPMVGTRDMYQLWLFVEGYYM